jgi:hypothetical protein
MSLDKIGISGIYKEASGSRSPGLRMNRDSIASRGTGRRIKEREPPSPAIQSIQKTGLSLHRAMGPTAYDEKNESVRSRP